LYIVFDKAKHPDALCETASKSEKAGRRFFWPVYFYAKKNGGPFDPPHIIKGIKSMDGNYSFFMQL